MALTLRILGNDDERMKSTKLLVLNILKINKFESSKAAQIFGFHFMDPVASICDIDSESDTEGSHLDYKQCRNS